MSNKMKTCTLLSLLFLICFAIQCTDTAKKDSSGEGDAAQTEGVDPLADKKLKAYSVQVSSGGTVDPEISCVDIDCTTTQQSQISSRAGSTTYALAFCLIDCDGGTSTIPFKVNLNNVLVGQGSCSVTSGVGSCSATLTLSEDTPVGSESLDIDIANNSETNSFSVDFQ